ncbi:MAG TPA: hypothetical protein VEL76_11400 [Gemmataceae bacterium]|nr:hypothetical protein [Gemmataceae bacterium]
MRHPFDGINAAPQATSPEQESNKQPARHTRRSFVRTLFAALGALVGLATVSRASERPPVSTTALGEEGGTTERLGEEGGGRPDMTTLMVGEEGGRCPNTKAAREEGSGPITAANIPSETGGRPITEAMPRYEDGGRPITKALIPSETGGTTRVCFEEGGKR